MYATVRNLRKNGDKAMKYGSGRVRTLHIDNVIWADFRPLYRGLPLGAAQLARRRGARIQRRGRSARPAVRTPYEIGGIRP